MKILASCRHYIGDFVDDVCPTCERNKQKNAALMERYRTDEKVRTLADSIHNSLMMAGPACESCIQTAVSRIDHT